jgi:hypothetical protein
MLTAKLIERYTLTLGGGTIPLNNSSDIFAVVIRCTCDDHIDSKMSEMGASVAICNRATRGDARAIMQWISVTGAEEFPCRR